MRIVVPFCIGVLIYVLCVSADHARLECLQFEQGKELEGTPWSQGYISADRRHQKEKSWIYNNTKCPLDLFSEQVFCQRAVKCGTHMLLVGDSTVMRIASTIPHLLTNEFQKAKCPTENFCSRSRGPRCNPGGHMEMVRMLKVCQNFCPTNRPVRITYIRHDYLNHIHGTSNYWSTICEHWKAVAKAVDYLVLSVGPHIRSMVTHPFGKPAPADFNAEAFFQAEAHETAKLVHQLLAPNATLIYRAGAVGILDYEIDCSLQPDDGPPRIHSNYSWDKIPALNKAYIQALTQEITDHPVLVMDTATLFTKMRGCRQDHLHFNDGSPAAPVLLEWLLLQNLLIELHNEYPDLGYGTRVEASASTMPGLDPSAPSNPDSGDSAGSSGAGRVDGGATYAVLAALCVAAVLGWMV